MSALSKNVKQELANALDDKNEVMFVADGKLISLEAHNTGSTVESLGKLEQEIELYTELKDSLQRYLDNPDMKRYTAKELKELRYDQRK
ncbi:hypothetical protein [Lentibacillus saliphilus]|uniref:hypothetical protein n=1 Tax=Lentibacillus saliphilus TaxID=2737028 RepID=UPI001C2F1AEE|nr:hypothetical protein [Lentibacillus saliphilus]